MTIKPEKEYYTSQIVGAVVLVCSFLMFLIYGVFCEKMLEDQDGKILIFLMCVIYIGLSISVIRYWMATGRTIIMNEEGCSVRFLWYRKEYRWDDFRIKAIETFTDALSYKTMYKKGAIFSTKPMRKPWWWDSIAYSWHIHPLSFIFVNFTPEVERYARYRFYEMDEKIFMEKMKSWNVELQNVNFFKNKRL